MARKISVKGDDISLMLRGSGFDYVDKLLDLAAPKTKKLLQDEFEKILDNARSKWLVRGAKPETVESMKERTFAAMTKTGKYTPDAARVIIEKMDMAGKFNADNSFRKSPKSQDSRGKLRMGVRVNQKFELVAFLANDAPYAWAIKVGENSDTDMAYGTRIADELMWKPVRKLADKIAKSMADEITKIL
tara:strand:+ start:262 stop:828 length:567 start_codon:yes stop_codon:yes gene_type:complete